MPTNVFFFDLRDAGTGNFGTLSDEKYLLWDKKAKDMQVGDYCIIYYRKNNVVLPSKIIQDKIYPKKEDDKWYVEFHDKRYYYEASKGEDEEFAVFEKFSTYTTDENLTISMQGGATLLTQSKDTEFKKNKLDKVVQLIKEKDIIKLLNRYTEKTIVDAIVDSLKVLGEATIAEIYQHSIDSKSYNFGAEDARGVIRIQLERHCVDSDWSKKASDQLFYKKGDKYGLIADVIRKDVSSSLLLSKKQIILYGPPGTGKTFNTRHLALALMQQKGA
jgi:hypothetical protein